ncbi:Beta-lactamase [Enhygromyxa salina]|uniref:Beta-lactamase n=1 Tax=Enhygromyxa salina TaxID=215803 RepID=A0A2S9XR89_9BACT|nr:serine hydrolase [Enhygromyxa salina]PRP95388.1 Beta-lactamase [Enhygromyxa salina]
MALDDAGDLIVVGSLQGNTNKDLWIEKRSGADGSTAWTVLEVSDFDGDNEPGDVELGADGSIFVSGTVRMGDDDTDVWVRKLSSADGAAAWTATYSGNTDMSGLSIDKGSQLAPAPDGSVYVDTVWSYSSGTTNLLQRRIRELFADDAADHRFPREALFEPLGMTSAIMETDPSGTFVGSSFMYATPRDWARFGQLFLQDGVSEGQRILPEGWVARSVTPTPTHPSAGYGLQWWLNAAEDPARRARCRTCRETPTGPRGTRARRSWSSPPGTR